MVVYEVSYGYFFLLDRVSWCKGLGKCEFELCGGVIDYFGVWIGVF